VSNGRTFSSVVDVAIVGGGAIGSSIAWHLASDPNFTGRIAVVERDPTYARASSALSASSIRQQFSTPLNIHLSRHGIDFLRRSKELLGVDLGLKEPGYLFLASAAGEAVLRGNNAGQRAEGCAVELLEPAALARRFPWIATDGVALASLGTANEGWFDGPSLMQAFRNAARDKGVGDKAGIGNRPRQPVELGNDERVACADRGERLVETGPRTVRAGQAVVGVDPVGGNAELFEGGPLGGEVLLVGRAAGVADQGRRHGRT